MPEMRIIETDFVGNRFLVRVSLPDSTRIRMLADTGGGYVVSPAVVGSLPWVAYPGAPGGLGVRLPVDPPMPAGHDIAALREPPGDQDGVISAWWFTDRIWCFDYRTGRLELHESASESGTVPLGFPVDDDGRLLGPFPRIRVTVDDESIDVLLDTGATVELTGHGVWELGEPRCQATSFIASDVFQRWQRRHPDWRIVEGASRYDSSPLIEVPEVVVGGAVLGPVWFEHRPNHSFHNFMSRWMDRPIDGALGGNAFAGRRVLVDYGGAVGTIC